MVCSIDRPPFFAEGHYRPALERCLVIAKMAPHVGDDNLISFLSNGAINVSANKGIRDILGYATRDVTEISGFDEVAGFDFAANYCEKG